MQKTSSPSSKRIMYFDYLKIIAIFLVVFIHRSWLDQSVSSNIATIICSICVPLFFMVNGALLFHKPFDINKHIKKVIILFISVEIWRIIYFVACILTNQITLQTFSKSQLWYYMCGSLNLDHVPTPHMWFTNTLLFLYLLFPLLKICWDFQKKALYFFTFICFLFFQVTEELNVILGLITKKLNITSTITLDGFKGTISPLANNGHFLVYFVLGAILHDIFFIKKNWKLSQNKTTLKFVCLILCVLGLIWDFIEKYLQCNSIIWTGVSFLNGYLKIGTLLMCIGIFIIFSQINFTDGCVYTIVSFFSKRTLDIYYIHMFFAAIALEQIYPLIHKENIIINSIRSIILILISIIIGSVIRQIPLLKNILNG